MSSSEFEAQLRLHDDWVASAGASGERLTLVEKDLRHLSLRDRNLVECALVDCDLSGVTFDGSDLYGAMLLRCALGDASFAGCNLSKANLDDVQAENATFDRAVMVDCSCTSADLRGARFRRAYLLSAGFDGADVRGATFEEVDCDRASFRDAVFDASQLSTAFAGAVGALLDGNVVVHDAGHRRVVPIDDVLEAADRGGADLSRLDPTRVGAFERPWRWGPSAP